MNSNQLKCAINCDSVMSQCVQGVFASDQLPSPSRPFPKGYIANTSSHDERGSHWVALYINKSNELEFFDSFGYPPQFYSTSLMNFCRKLNFPVRANNKRLQDEGSMVCGHYCLYFLLMRCRGLSMEEITTTFEENYKQNDLYVYEYITTSFPYCL